jgi:hypothetical protein
MAALRWRKAAVTLAERLADSLDARDRRARMKSATGYRAAVARRGSAPTSAMSVQGVCRWADRVRLRGQAATPQLGAVVTRQPLRRAASNA